MAKWNDADIEELMIRTGPFTLNGGQWTWNINGLCLGVSMAISRLFGLKWTPVITLVVTLARLFIYMGILLKWAMKSFRKAQSVSSRFFNTRANSLTFQNCSVCWGELKYNITWKQICSEDNEAIILTMGKIFPTYAETYQTELNCL